MKVVIHVQEEKPSEGRWHTIARHEAPVIPYTRNIFTKNKYTISCICMILIRQTIARMDCMARKLGSIRMIQVGDVVDGKFLPNLVKEIGVKQRGHDYITWQMFSDISGHGNV